MTCSLSLVVLLIGVAGVQYAVGMGKPNFYTLKSSYPTPSSYPNIAATAGLGSYLYGLNSCAIRLSYALYQSGQTIDIGRNECNWSKEKSSNGDKYIIRVDTFRCFLSNEWGSPISTSFRSTLNGKKGVIAFKDCSFSDATGHVDVWDGSDCVNQCYFSECGQYYLWEL